MIPTVGRLVHYQAYGTPGGEYPSIERAAVVTAVEPHYKPIRDGSPEEAEYKVSLCVLNPTGQFFNQDVPYSAEPKPGHWNWMPYQTKRHEMDKLPCGCRLTCDGHNTQSP